MESTQTSGTSADTPTVVYRKGSGYAPRIVGLRMRYETDILLTLPWPAHADPNELDNKACEVFEVIEEHAMCAIGPVVAVRYDEPSIEVAFTLCTASPEEVHAKVGEVVGMVEQHVGVNVSGPITSVRAPEHEHPHLLVC